jgi:acyl carrier protein
MKMKKDEFFKELLECMEIEPVALNEETVFKELEDYDSMAVMSIVAFADEKFGAVLAAEDLEKMVTVGDLMALIGPGHFE